MVGPYVEAELLTSILIGTNKTSLDSINNDLRFILASPFPDLSWLGRDVKIAKSVQVSTSEVSVSMKQS